MSLKAGEGGRALGLLVDGVLKLQAALMFTILTWRDDQTMQHDAAARCVQRLRGIKLSRGRSAGFGALQKEERILDVFVRGRGSYFANLNAANPIGAVQSIEQEHADFTTSMGEGGWRQLRRKCEFAGAGEEGLPVERVSEIPRG